MKTLSFVINCFLIFCVVSCLPSKDIKITKRSGTQIVDEKTIVYALPQTCVNITLEVTKTTIKKGPFAEFAQKYLDITNVPLNDSEFYAISDVKVLPQLEADPAQFYGITFKTFPDNLSNLFSLSNKGIVLDFANSWRKGVDSLKPLSKDSDFIFDPNLTNETITEKVDTFYKTVVTDTSFRRIPIFKKQVSAKSNEEMAKETAHELIKTRKRKLKILRGEYEFHPDGKALEVMINELNKEEETLLKMFNGIKLTNKQYFRFTEVPQTEPFSKELCYFTTDMGIQNFKSEGCSIISVQITREQQPTQQSSIAESQSNILYIRVPAMTKVEVLKDDTNITQTRMPVYQFGSVQIVPFR
jgi:hypothetical protein